MQTVIIEKKKKIIKTRRGVDLKTRFFVRRYFNSGVANLKDMHKP